MDKNLPSVSILTMSYNPELGLFEEFLKRIKLQDYPRAKIEHLIMDGGSANGAIELARKYGVKVHSDSKLKDEISMRQSMLLHGAKNDIVVWLETDNLFIDKTALRKLVRPFVENDDVIASYSFHYSYNPKLAFLDRYCALMGLSDPIVHYLGKADRRPWFEKRANYPKVEDRKTYSIIQFDENNLPTVGDNGFLARRKILLKAKTSPAYFFHTDVFFDLLGKGYNKYAAVYDTSIEHVIRSDFLKLIRRRIEYMERDAQPTMLKNRRYQIFDPKRRKDKINLVLFGIFTFTLIQPLLVSLRGYLKIRDRAWFAHILMCWLFLIYYGRSTFLRVLKSK